MIVCHKTSYIVDADIKGFFDNVNHEWMMKFLEERIADPNLLRLIKRFLKAGIMEEGVYVETDKGTIQGGLISPILANIYLHYSLDLWFEKVIKKRCQGEAQIVRGRLCMLFSKQKRSRRILQRFNRKTEEIWSRD